MEEALSEDGRRRDPPLARWIALAALAAMALVVLALAGRPLATDDTWWHLELGELYATGDLWPDADPMLHTAGARKPVPHEWLFQVGLFATERATGLFGLRALHVALAAAAIALAFAAFRRASGSTVAACAAAVLFLVLAWYRLFQLRPDVVSIPATLLLYRLLLAARRAPAARHAAAAALLFGVWANVHSLFAVGLALALAALLGALGEDALRATRAVDAPGRRTSARGLATVLGAGFLASLLNPRGLAQHALFLSEAGRGSIWRIRDDFGGLDLAAAVGRADPWLTPLSVGALALVLAATAAAVASGLWRLARERSDRALADVDALHLGLAAAASVAMVAAVRFQWLAVFPLLYLLRFERRRAARHPHTARAISWGLAAAAAGAALVFPGSIGLRAFAREIALEEGGYWRTPYLRHRYCEAGVRFLEDAKVEGNLFNEFNMGGFLGYRLAPRLRTFIDGRMDHFPPEVLDDYLEIRRASRVGPPGRLRRFLAERNVDVYFGTSFPEERYAGRQTVAVLRELPEWALVFASRDCSIYLRRDPENRRNALRVARYFRRRGIRFAPAEGLDVAALVRERPDWAYENDVLPRDFEALLARRESPDPGVRARALEELAELYERIGHPEAERARRAARRARSSGP